MRSPGKASIPTADCVSPSSSDIGAPTHSSERAAIPQSIRMVKFDRYTISKLKIFWLLRMTIFN